jgi:hypothetical protein
MPQASAQYGADPTLTSPSWYGPVCPVVWEGWHREVPNDPD